jgi:hypothetical protein
VAIEPETTLVSFWERTRSPWSVVGTATTLALLSACNSDKLLATYECKQWPGASGADAGDWRTWLEPPWSTSFEDNFCGYSEARGFCYTRGNNNAAKYELVESPVHTGHYAAAYTVQADGTDSTSQSRCFLGGDLPSQAYYSAWFYLPKQAKIVDNSNWNLVHFEGGDTPARHFNTWDISLETASDGGLRLKVVDSIRDSAIPDLAERPNVPIGKWFRISMFLKRATDATGIVRVSQDNLEILNATTITDAYPYNEWYVGNLAEHLDPPGYTLFVDDVSVGPQPPQP